MINLYSNKCVNTKADIWVRVKAWIYSLKVLSLAADVTGKDNSMSTL